MLIKAGDYKLWPDFSLSVECDLILPPEQHYYLQGDNGSGKSSFIRKLLLPLLKQTGCYHLYWEQQIHLQHYIIRAHAALHHHPIPAATDLDCLRYLLMDLALAYHQQPRATHFVVDECTFFQELVNLVQESGIPTSLIYSHHDGKLLDTDCQTLVFTKLSSSQSVLSVPTV